MSDSHFYVTTTLPYVNASPHIGFGLEITAADVIARYQKMLGKKVIFNTGTDEHGQKIYQKALKNDQTMQGYCDFYAQKFADLKKYLDLSYTNFIRTTDEHHLKAAQKFWQLAEKNGDIYKAKYKVKYCVGCELEKTDSELVDGRCPLHPKYDLEIREEENYFFKFSQYQEQLLELYEKQADFVQPPGKFNEIKAFVQQGLKDFSISRLKEKMPWGIPVPGDENHVMYVWFDALINYISTLGWPEDEKNSDYANFWPGVQLAGKDNLRQQSAMWQAMLMSAGLPNSQKILINGFINVEGQKMSKSLGNVISPEDMFQRYGSQASRYLLISLGVFAEDMDVSWTKFDEKYTADLANGIGNLCSRVAKMAATEEIVAPKADIQLNENYQQLMADYELTKALDWVQDQVAEADKFLSETKPWKIEGEEKQQVLLTAIEKIQTIAVHLQPFMPETAAQIQQSFTGEIKPMQPMFPRLD